MRRSWLVAAALAAAAVVAVVLVVSLREDDSGSLSATAWAGSVCASLSEWRSSITALADVSGAALTKESLQEKLDAAAEATTKLTTDLRALGPPDFASGDALKQELDGAVDTLEATYEELKAGAQEALDAGDPASFLRGLAELAPTFQRLLDEIAQLTETLQQSDAAGDVRAELEQAFRDAEPCQELQVES